MSGSCWPRLLWQRSRVGGLGWKRPSAVRADPAYGRPGGCGSAAATAAAGAAPPARAGPLALAAGAQDAARFAFRYRSKTYLDPQQKEWLSQPAYWVLDAGLVWRSPGEHVKLAGWVRNLTDAHYVTDAFDQKIADKQIFYVHADPRLFGGSVRYRW